MGRESRPGAMMRSTITFAAVNRLLLLYWAAWLSFVAATNVLNALQALGTLPQSFRFVSDNWQLINSVMNPLAVPRALQAFLFAGAIGWETLSAILFWRALVSYRGRPLAQEPATLWACVVNLTLWAAFQVLDEVFIAYGPEDSHRMIFIIQIGTLLWLQLAPAKPTDAEV
jgi:hypothetical protein